MRPLTETVFKSLRCAACNRWTPHSQTTRRDLDRVTVNTRCNRCGATSLSEEGNA